MNEATIKMVGSKLVVEISVAAVLEQVAGGGKLALEITPAQVIQAVRDAAPKPSVPGEAPAVKPGPKPGPKPVTAASA